jgi:alkanesulfonate monooxygenase SsuD/methylene tetrahydromethanopterin reductase-like flavin-dependent oxidoreductase (luciferase family)
MAGSAVKSWGRQGGDVTSVDPRPRVGMVFRPQLPPERLRHFVARTEQGGLDDLWLWEDCFLEGGLTCAAMALAWSDTIRVGLGLLPVPLRNSAVSAMEIAVLARLFPGRFIPAAGHGVLSWMDQVGARAASPMTLLREWVTATRSLLHGETVTADGDYVRLRQVALDWPPATPPNLLVGARGPKTLVLAGEISDGLVLDAGITPDLVRKAIATATAATPDRTLEVVVYVACGQGDGARDRLASDVSSYGALASEATAVGSPADVAAVIGAYADAGATTVALQPAGDDPHLDATIDLVVEARALL